MIKLSIIYYSATGHGTAMARRVAEAAEGAGAEVRLRHVAETRDPESFAQNRRTRIRRADTSRWCSPRRAAAHT